MKRINREVTEAYVEGLALDMLPMGGVARGASKGKVVIGETMRRVRAYAGRVDAETFETGAQTLKKMWKENSTWFRKAMREGKEVIDIGEDASRAVRSKFYQAERELAERRGYPLTRDPQP